MKVLDLACHAGHAFEGWFGSEEDFVSQHRRGLVECPMCASREIHKKPSAPRLNLRHGADRPGKSAPVQDGEASRTESPQAMPATEAEVWRAVREWVSRTEDVGDRFAEEARRMHEGEIERRDIRGRASLEQAQSLVEDGVPVVPLPDWPVLKHRLQ